jgi:hypothetical protein
MNGSMRLFFQARHLLLSSLVGALIAAASSIAYVNSERTLPSIIGIVISTVSLAFIPGYILCALLTNNIHDANVLLAAVMNFVLYSGLLLWILSLRSRRRRSAPVRS